MSCCGMHTINGDPNVAKLQKYTIELYKEIEELSGQATGVHVTGGVLLAATEARMDWLRGLVAKGRYLGLDLEEISANEAAELMPLLDPKQFVGAVRNSEDGHLDPSGVTHAYAKAARKLGAEVERFTKVEEIVRREDGLWRVITNKGEIVAEHVVNAGGLCRHREHHGRRRVSGASARHVEPGAPDRNLMDLHSVAFG